MFPREHACFALMKGSVILVSSLITILYTCTIYVIFFGKTSTKPYCGCDLELVDPVCATAGFYVANICLLNCSNLTIDDSESACNMSPSQFSSSVNSSSITERQNEIYVGTFDTKSFLRFPQENFDLIDSTTNHTSYEYETLESGTDFLVSPASIIWRVDMNGNYYVSVPDSATSILNTTNTTSDGTTTYDSLIGTLYDLKPTQQFLLRPGKNPRVSISSSSRRLSVIGDDDLVMVDSYFNRTASPLWTADLSGCTGSLISPSYMLTAAHCVYSRTSSTFVYQPDAWLGRLDGFIPTDVLDESDQSMFDSFENVTGELINWDLNNTTKSIYATRVAVNSMIFLGEYVTSNDTDRRYVDIALLELAVPIGDVFGHFGFGLPACTDSALLTVYNSSDDSITSVLPPFISNTSDTYSPDFLDDLMHVEGYPTSSSGKPDGTLWESTCSLRESLAITNTSLFREPDYNANYQCPLLIEHLCDTYGGMSGSPIWTQLVRYNHESDQQVSDMGEASNGVPFILAVHTLGVTRDGVPVFNRAPILNERLFRFIEETTGVTSGSRSLYDAEGRFNQVVDNADQSDSGWSSWLDGQSNTVENAAELDAAQANVTDSVSASMRGADRRLKKETEF